MDKVSIDKNTFYCIEEIVGYIIKNPVKDLEAAVSVVYDWLENNRYSDGFEQLP